MLDFFSYSAFSVQCSLKNVDFAVQSVGSKSETFDTLRRDLSQTQTMSNVFAIAKMGLSNLIFPSQLDVKISNYQNYPGYIRLSDAFCPQMSHSEHSVLLLRPIVVKNGLNEILM